MLTAISGKSGSRKRGDIVELDYNKAKKLIDRGYAVAVGENKAKTREKATIAPGETREPKHVGGGWYELPNGERVKGKDEADRRMKEGV